MRATPEEREAISAKEKSVTSLAAVIADVDKATELGEIYNTSEIREITSWIAQGFSLDEAIQLLELQLRNQ